MESLPCIQHVDTYVLYGILAHLSRFGLFCRENMLKFQAKLRFTINQDFGEYVAKTVNGLDSNPGGHNPQATVAHITFSRWLEPFSQ